MTTPASECARCGYTLAPTDVECPDCHTPVPGRSGSAANPAPAGPRQPNRLIGALLVAVPVVLCIIVLYATNVFGYVDIQKALRSQANNATPAAILASDPTQALPATAPALQITPATAVPTSIPTASPAAPNPTVTVTPAANSSKGLLLIEYGLVSTNEINGLKGAYPGWSIQTYGSNDKINFYQAMVDIGAKYDGKVLVFTSGRDAASPEGYTLDSVIEALQGKDITFLVLKKAGDDSSLFASLIADRIGGAVITSTDKNELAQRTLELMK